MTQAATPYERSASTQWVTEIRKIQKRPRGQQAMSAAGRPTPGQSSKPLRWSQLLRLDGKRRRDKVTLTITYRGGPECWYEITARGVTARRPGFVALHDLMCEVYGDHGPDLRVPWDVMGELGITSRRQRRRELLEQRQGDAGNA